LLGEEGGKREGEERHVEEREMRNILVVYEFAELDVEPAGECFLWFGSTVGLFVEPTVNALKTS
jgi:hypothetical protein